MFWYSVTGCRTTNSSPDRNRASSTGRFAAWFSRRSDGCATPENTTFATPVRCAAATTFRPSRASSTANAGPTWKTASTPRIASARLRSSRRSPSTASAAPFFRAIAACASPRTNPRTTAPRAASSGTTSPANFPAAPTTRTVGPCPVITSPDPSDTPTTIRARRPEPDPASAGRSPSNAGWRAGRTAGTIGEVRTSSPRELLSGVTTAPDALALFRRTSTGLRRHVPFDAALWRATDPVTGLTTAPVPVENLSEGGCGAYWESELFEQNVVLFRDLVRAAVPAAALRATTGDRPRMSALYERFMRPRNLADELRAVFRVDGRAWGMLSLFRERGRRPFDDDDTLLLGRLSGPLAHRLRSYARPAPVPSTGDSGGAGVLVFDTDVNLISINARARRLLAEMPPSAGLPTRFGIDVPAWVLSTALSARTSADARIRVRSRTGGWLICHGTALRGPDGRVTSTAMVIEP